MDNNLVENDFTSSSNSGRKIGDPETILTPTSSTVAVPAESNTVPDSMAEISAAKTIVSPALVGVNETETVVDEGAVRSYRNKKILMVVLLVLFAVSLAGNGALGYLLRNKERAYQAQRTLVDSQNKDNKKQQLIIDNKSNCPEVTPVAAAVETPAVAAPAAAAPAATSTVKKNTTSSNTQEVVIAPPPPPSN